MNREIEHIINKQKYRWVGLLFFELLLLGVSVGLLLQLIFMSIKLDVFIMFPLTFCVLAVLIIGGLYYKKRLNNRNILRLMNRQFSQVEDSMHLFLLTEDELNRLEKLQLNKLIEILSHKKIRVSFNSRLYTFLILLIVSVIIFMLALKLPVHPQSNDEQSANTLAFTPIDSLNSVTETTLVLVKQLEIILNSPAYTGQKTNLQTNWDLKCIEGTQTNWSVKFDGEVMEASLLFSNGTIVNLSKRKGKYVGSQSLNEQGYYELVFTDTLNNSYKSEFFKVEVVKDQTPKIAIEGIAQYEEFDFEEKKSVSFSAKIEDDFGVSDVSITATITKGAGESVKFREEKLFFDNTLNVNGKNQLLKKYISFVDMKMEPGDELYFYIEAKDNKYPLGNIARSETYFVVLRDTANYEFTLEGDLGVDLMPDYFRSQRQIIIDTEKLLATKKKLTDYEFKSKSNELGFDQKTLRLKYGQFMGEEDDSGIATSTEVAIEDEMTSEEGNDEKDVLAGYKHDHDNENEHNLVDNHEHELNDQGEEVEDPLEDYKHNHDDQEVATFLTNTIKGKLRAAMTLMWDAELYLRLYQPQNSLPYQYKALALIKEIKNHARIYVHRVGFDPPPIKEESRLSGDLEDVNTKNRNSSVANEDVFVHTKKVLSILNQEIDERKLDDIEIFENSGKELAPFAIQDPGKYLNSLQLLKKISGKEDVLESEIQSLKADLYSILPETLLLPNKQHQTMTNLQKLYFKELNGRGGDQ